MFGFPRTLQTGHDYLSGTHEMTLTLTLPTDWDTTDWTAHVFFKRHRLLRSGVLSAFWIQTAPGCVVSLPNSFFSVLFFLFFFLFCIF